MQPTAAPLTLANSKELRQKTNSQLLDLMYNIISQLYFRWLDEKEYEDFSEYAKVMERVLGEVAPTVKFIKATQRPFGCLVQIPDMPYKTHLITNSKAAGWKVVLK